MFLLVRNRRCPGHLPGCKLSARATLPGLATFVLGTLKPVLLRKNPQSPLQNGEIPANGSFSMHTDIINHLQTGVLSVHSDNVLIDYLIWSMVLLVARLSKEEKKRVSGVLARM